MPCTWASFEIQLVKNHLCRRPWFNSWVGKIPCRRDRLPTPVFLGFMVAHMLKNSPAMQKTWVRTLGWGDPLEEGMATHFSILAWTGKSSWTEEPGGLPLMGSKRVGHD